MNDSFWYLRAETPEEKQKWLEALEAHKVSLYSCVVAMEMNWMDWSCDDLISSLG